MIKYIYVFLFRWSLLFLLLITSGLQATAKVNRSYTIEGKTNKYGSVKVTYRFNGHTIENIAPIRDGVLKISGKVGIRTEANLLLIPKETNFVSPGVQPPMKINTRFWLEPGVIEVSGIDSAKFSFSGTPLNDEQRALKSQLNSTALQFKEWSSKNGDQTDTSKVFKKKLNDETERAQQEANAINIQFIKSHPNSLVSLNQLDYELSRGVPDVALVEPLFNSLSTAVRNTIQGKEYKTKLTGWKQVNIGSIAPDFTQPDQNGKPIKLSDFKGKYILLDFWASWCHPCREGHPNLVQQYNLYKNKNFTILSVSLDGGGFGTKANWLKAIEEDHIDQWTQLCDLAGSQVNKVSKMYGVGSIPQNFLIDPNGKIVAKSLHGEEFNNKLKELFGGNFKPDNKADRSIQKPVAAYADTEVLPLDPAVRTGKLANGFTYYIRKNKQPENKVYFYLANKVGSILENDDQQGLAHFIEHMNFNGTKHFPKNELVDYLQKAGVRFGADINAYTGFEETVYQLPLPSDKPEVVNNGIEIMHDWAQGALLDSVEIDKERGVILEEARLRKGANDRIYKKIWPVIFNKSRYVNRSPIGVDTILKNFKTQTLRGFYKDWYRPNLQALIVVGDIDVNQIEKRIKEEFVDLKNPVDEKERLKYAITLTGENQFSKVTDKELDILKIQVHFKHYEPAFNTAADYRSYLMRQLLNSMINDRFGEASDGRNNPPFLNAGGGINNLLANIDQFSMAATAKPGKLENSFKAIWHIIEQIKRFGFTSTELERAKKAILARRETAAMQKEKASSEGMVREYVQTFLRGVPAPGVEAELQLVKQYLSVIKLEDLLKLAGEYIKDADRDIIIIGPEIDAAKLPDEKTVDQWITDVRSENITLYQDKFVEKELMKTLPVPGKVISEKMLPSLNATEWILSNGVKVIVKPTDFETDDVSFLAFSPGGNSTFSDDDYPAISNLPIVVTTSGVGDYSYQELNQFLSGKNLNFGLGMDTYGAAFSGFSSQKYLENMLQIINMYFTQPKYDQKVFDGLVASLKASVKKQVVDPEESYSRMLTSIILNGNVRSRPLTLEQIEKMKLSTIVKAYQKQFGDAANFTFLFAGNIDMAKLKVFVETYVASMPSASGKLKSRNLNMYPPAGKITKTLYRGTENKSRVTLIFSGKYEFNAVNNKLLDAIKEIIQIRVVNRLREKESGIYSPNISASYTKVPEEQYRFNIGFGCAPESVDNLIASALDEVRKLVENGPDEIEVEKYKAGDILSQKSNLKSNNAWLNYFQEQLKNGESLNEVNEHESIMQQVNQENIRTAAKKYLNDKNFIRLVLMPEKSAK